MRRTFFLWLLAATVVAAATVTAATAQTSASYRVTESTFNAGGDPRDRAYARSANQRVRLDAIGDAVASSAALQSVSHRVSSGFVTEFPPPGEVLALRVDRLGTLSWSPDASVGSYSVYRDSVGALPGSFGACLQGGVTREEYRDSGRPGSGTGWFYLVTARNRLDEEGTRGNGSSGAERPATSPCP